MSDQTDFNALYRELGIEPDCALDDFRLAYRRRVADLHPDRVGASGEDGLKSLNLRYAAALEFHRHYGRLPGAPSPPLATRAAPAVEPSRWTPSPDTDASSLDARESRRPSKFVGYGMVLLAVLLVWWLSRTDAGSLGFEGIGVVGSEREKAPSAAIALRLGMTREQVLAMLGEPVAREQGGMHWTYGPSWVRFECMELVNWYSSPLQPLRASRPRPPQDASMHAAAVAARPCPAAAAVSSHHWRAP